MRFYLIWGQASVPINLMCTLCAGYRYMYEFKLRFATYFLNM